MAIEPNELVPNTQWEKLRSSANYRAFLKAYLQERSLSLSDLARATGFARGFPSDVISGRRRLTAQSCFAFEKALRLPAPGRKLFRLLVAFEEPDLFPDVDRKIIAHTIEDLRRKPWRKARREILSAEDLKAHDVLCSLRSAMVYAACGSPEQPATWNQLLHRTQISEDLLLAEVERMMSAGLIQKIKKSSESEALFVPQDLHVFIQPDQSTNLMKSIFRESARAAAERAETAMNSESEFFFSSVFTVNSSRLPELKKTLREAILKFVDESLQADGESLAKVIVGLHR